MAHANKTPMGNEQARTQSRFFQSETLTLNSCLSLDYFTDLCKPIETYIYARKKHPFASYPAAKHPKHSKFTVTDIREKPVNFLHCSTRASTLVSAILLLSRAPLHKFQFLFINLIPWLDKVHWIRLLEMVHTLNLHVRGPKSQVVSQQLHYKCRILIAFLIQCV